MEIVLTKLNTPGLRKCCVTGAYYEVQEGQVEFTTKAGLPISPNYGMQTDFTVDPSVEPIENFKSKVEVSEWLAKSGIPRNSKIYDRLYAQHSKNLPAGYVWNGK